MKKWAFVIFICGVIAFVFWNANRYVPYCPVVRVWNGEDRYDKTHLTDIHLDNICKILDEYNEPYRRENGQVLIKNKLLKDMDLLANYTWKAHYGDDETPLPLTQITDAITQVVDRLNTGKELNYYFYSSKCFITEDTFSAGNSTPISRKYFMVDKVDTSALQDCCVEFVRHGISPQWEKAPPLKLNMWYRGYISKVFGYMNPVICQKLLSGIEKLVREKHEVSQIPSFFMHTPNKAVLDIIQFVSDKQQRSEKSGTH